MEKFSRPSSTYRFQFHKGFTFKDLERLQNYLQELGISAVYASPLFTAVPGSTHGYDVLHPNSINPELGTLRQLKALIRNLQQKGIDWLQDIVPNHMGFHSENPWLSDVLEKGSKSAYASFFDTSLYSNFFSGRLMVPFLGASLEEVLKNGELKIAYAEQRLVFRYYGQEWPLHPLSYRDILVSCMDGTEQNCRELAGQITRIQQLNDARTYALQWNEFRLQLAALMKTGEAGQHLREYLEKINNRPDQLRDIAGQQAYRLCSWKETGERINYRRFFTINGLICLNMQEKAVFREYHNLIASLLEESCFAGIRVDHVDGLYDPAGYLEQLRELAGEKTYIIVEKILESNEEFPAGWPVQGSSGYDFLALVNNLFTRSSNKEVFSRFYRELTGEALSVQEQIREKKAAILQAHMNGELENLCALFLHLLETDTQRGKEVASESRERPESGEPSRPVSDFSDVAEGDLKQAIAAFLVHCPVYRYYGNHFPLEENESIALRNILHQAGAHQPDLIPAFRLLEEALLQWPLERSEAYRKEALCFYSRCMQFSGPLMAKGVEDTLMYTYNRFIGHNEVGDSPDAFGISPEVFHREMKIRRERWPQSMNATATHDTKRGEDLRARLNVLTCIPREWMKAVREWRRLNKDLKQQGAPDANEEYFIYQTLAGAWPMREEEEEGFGSRLRGYLVKVLREGKRHSNWENPDEDYERAVTGFADALLDKKRPFRRHFLEFFEKTRDPGRINSLAQVLLKFTCPGVPDTYQGCELWDLSLVDPDNRRPVDYEQRQQWLTALQSAKGKPAALLQELWEDTATARIKLFLVHRLLRERKQHPLPFVQGQYIPLTIKGRYRKFILAFARRYDSDWYLTIVPLHPAVLCRRQKKEINTIDWKDTRIILPPEAPGEWEHLLDGTSGRAAFSTIVNGTTSGATGGTTDSAAKSREPAINIAAIFSVLPLALLKLKSPAAGRSAGVLMHITSLPSPFGAGDLGVGAREFAGFLSRSGQRCWQLLPLNPVAAEQLYSPYSPVSSMAGNPLLLSPEQLAEDGWLPLSELRETQQPDNKDLTHAVRIREQILNKAWKNYREKALPSRDLPFRQFCAEEAVWLEDFALYMVLKKQHEGQPWYSWPEKYRLRDKMALKELRTVQENAIDKEKWLQFLFSRQWKALREHCASLGIRMFGDLPFYISYDSADVWSNPEIFCLDRDGRMTAVAGVPPDYFNRNGQLWGMPVFRWDVLKAQGYDWWVRRLRRNMEWYDLLRLDHFRAFSAYWEVPAGEKTAVNGQWKAGPGADLFHTLRRELGSLPFVAEDLGDIDEAVYRLRDEFGLPGMKVLQFAFGENMAHSPHIPHQYSPEFIVYTGTHDNNTTRGWFEKELGSEGRRQLREYTGKPVSAKNVHETLARMAYSSVARIAVLPLQDILGLDEQARMNVPASITGNWKWRLPPGLLNPRVEEQLLKWVKLYGRE
ncbi:4-alpha-glucanotransferase/malto-oligosyltrehalose synthase,TIGR02401 [Anseongella ginsenosidimutans]|uniref:4-alpha-glucanotransferase n=1 Tax=Anseongella ginsenosidimutans TaxID=496056 RepID=A0A4R3KSX8_9SPHI|nr:4-alpha-glucanotransferase [Anseongella ginsenosidimutans]QEC53083.1 4-alpha-glucanotransferase [Anseongella ginsenosidimutans]TCS87699.1 4-alpha-glucanotransferase/malto-oligosyltrehalose synthase,TIGR02401 [Anseongella ginsenosidimutans]